jgi:hypothetical protein
MATNHTTHDGVNRRGQQMRKYLGAVVLAASVVSCKASDLNLPNPNQVTPTGAAADPTSLQLLATGLFTDQRGTRTGYISAVGIFGRESYVFTPQEGRNTTTYLIPVVNGSKLELDATQFAGTAAWSGQYGALRDVFNFKTTVNGSSLPASQKAAALGLAQTMESIMLLEVIATHDTTGAIVQIQSNPFLLAPFVSRDSVYKYILGTLDAAASNLQAGGAAFPFTLPPGFNGFNTPSTFLQFNRALKAKAASYYATAGGGSGAWQQALTALQSSFLNAAATSRAALDAGVYDTYGAAPDSPNGLTQATNTSLYAHMSWQADVQHKADGTTPDDRYTAKIRTGLPSRQGPVTSSGPTSASSTLGFSIWPTVASSVPIIRNEELILIRAEGELATGNKTAAIADLNIVRQNSGGLPASTLTASSSDDAVLEGILYEKRFSLMMEGDRWIDMRRYNKLSELPLDVTSGPNKNFVAKVVPVPQAECLVRATASGDFLGPGGLNNCTP